MQREVGMQRHGFIWMWPLTFLAVMACGLVAAITSASATPGDLLNCKAAPANETVYDFNSSLTNEAMNGFRSLFPNAKQLPSQSELANGVKFRCVSGKMLVCFIGANLPCSKLNADKENAGAIAFCYDNSEAADVPLVATGHDSLFTYRCRRGQPEISGQLYHLDAQGFAKELWAPVAPVEKAAALSGDDQIEERAKACLHAPAGQTTSGMTACSHEAYVAYDKRLNDTYQKALNSLDRQSADLVRQSQRRWLAWQEAERAADNGPWRESRGSMASPDIEALKIDEIRLQIRHLEYYLTN